MKAFERLSSFDIHNVENLHLQIHMAPPMNTSKPPIAILYVLDPEPELFISAMSHLYGRAGYYEETSILHRIAIAGVGFSPHTFDAHPHGWNVNLLRNLRRAYFADKHNNTFAHVVCTHVIPECERRFQNCFNPIRCILGASLSSIAALRILFEYNDFQYGILGSPSIPLCPWIEDIVSENKESRKCSSIIISGSYETDENGIPQKAQEFVDALNLDMRVHVVLNEYHGTVKGSIVSQGIQFLESKLLNLS